VSLAELRISNVRCIESAQLELSPELNLISGPNGSGKTSILEAVFLLGRGRSFRTRSSERLVRHGQDALTVFGRTHDVPARTAGVEIGKERTRARLNGQDTSSLLELSNFLPVQSIDPEIHKLIDQGSERRRRWLDWLVFHVEQGFGTHWSRYQRALKQRNAALRSGSGAFTTWDAQLVEHGIAISEARHAAMTTLQPYLQSLLAKFSGLEISWSLHSGWSAEQTLDEALRLNATRDTERLTTTSGPHRADVALRTNGRIARETLSRGQQKLVAVAMIVSQIQLLRTMQGTQTVLLLDDPAAELDPRNLARLFEELAGLNCQMIATSLTPETTLFQAPKATFHVEQGAVIRV
jgi:DNA replication and repair protein RecF